MRRRATEVSVGQRVKGHESKTIDNWARIVTNRRKRSDKKSVNERLAMKRRSDTHSLNGELCDEKTTECSVKNAQSKERLAEIDVVPARPKVNDDKSCQSAERNRNNQAKQ
jgi:hypothetical protein